MNADSELTWLAFRPRDTLFIRDGRAFDAASDQTAVAVAPWPSTIAGATRSAYDAEPDEVCGPVLARQSSSGQWMPYFPVPLDVVATTGTATPYAVRLTHKRVDGTTDLDAVGSPHEFLVAPAGWSGKVEPITGWLDRAQLGAYLVGALPGAAGTRLADLTVADPVWSEQRIGLALDSEARTARSGFLYQTRHLRLSDGWAYLAGCRRRGGWTRTPNGPVPFGGRNRLADVEPAPGADWPKWPARFPAGRVLVYVATPAIWPGGWMIPVPPGARLVAAATGAPQPVATTSPRTGWKATRALRWAVPAGSVYLLDFDGDEARAGKWARQVHGTAYLPTPDAPIQQGPPPSTGLVGQRLRTAGFGVLLTGVWA